MSTPHKRCALIVARVLGSALDTHCDGLYEAVAFSESSSSPRTLLAGARRRVEVQGQDPSVYEEHETGISLGGSGGGELSADPAPLLVRVHTFRHAPYGEERLGTWAAQRRVANPCVLRYCLERRLPDGVVPTRTIDDVLQALTEPEQLRATGPHTESGEAEAPHEPRG